MADSRSHQPGHKSQGTRGSCLVCISFTGEYASVMGWGKVNWALRPAEQCFLLEVGLYSASGVGALRAEDHLISTSLSCRDSFLGRSSSQELEEWTLGWATFSLGSVGSHGFLPLPC